MACGFFVRFLERRECCAWSCVVFCVVVLSIFSPLVFSTALIG